MNINVSLKTTHLLKDLIVSGAFVGDHYKWTHPSQINFISGYKNKYSFYDIAFDIALLTKATRFLKIASKSKNVNFVFVGNPPNGEKASAFIFKRMDQPFFPNFEWEPGFISKKEYKADTILVICDISKNSAAYEEAVKSKVPVVAFVTPACQIDGVDYPVFLNLTHNSLWFAHFCQALLKIKPKIPSKLVTVKLKTKKYKK